MYPNISLDISFVNFKKLTKWSKLFGYFATDISDISNISMGISFSKRYIFGYIWISADISIKLVKYPKNSQINGTLLENLANLIKSKI